MQKNSIDTYFLNLFKNFDKNNFAKFARIRNSIQQKDFIISLDLVAGIPQSKYVILDPKTIFILSSVRSNSALKIGESRAPLILIKDSNRNINFAGGSIGELNQALQSSQNFGPSIDALNIGGSEMKILSDPKNLPYAFDDRADVSIQGFSDSSQTIDIILTGWNIYTSELE
jgi:hypothetical protein